MKKWSFTVVSVRLVSRSSELGCEAVLTLGANSSFPTLFELPISREEAKEWGSRVGDKVEIAAEVVPREKASG